MCNNDSFQFSDITNPYTPVRDYSIYGKGTAVNPGPALAKQCWEGTQGVTFGCEHKKTH